MRVPGLSEEEQQQCLEELVRLGHVASVEEARRAGIVAWGVFTEAALANESEILTAAFQKEMQARLDDPRPRIPAKEVFRQLEEHMAKREKAARLAEVRRKLAEAADDPRPSIPAEKVRKHLKALHKETLKGSK
jgi:hypothetical protein